MTQLPGPMFTMKVPLIDEDKGKCEVIVHLILAFYSYTRIMIIKMLKSKSLHKIVLRNVDDAYTLLENRNIKFDSSRDSLLHFVD